jgi:3-deoxy-D-manno-octulosonic acid kinase
MVATHAPKDRQFRPVRLGEHGSAGRALLWDSDIFATAPADDLFDPEAWRARGELLHAAAGRGAAYFLRAGSGANWVLRHYRRAGLLARINHDRYLWTGAEHTRPVREARLLAALYNRGIAVPRPVAARAVRQGRTYRADLITVAIAASQALADRLQAGRLSASGWQALGAVIAGLHRTGIRHADLNARNILLVGDKTFYLIDFDRASYRGDGAWRQANLDRLKRSLDKFAARSPVFYFRARDWAALTLAYQSTFADL